MGKKGRGREGKGRGKKGRGRGKKGKGREKGREGRPEMEGKVKATGERGKLKIRRVGKKIKLVATFNLVKFSL